MQAGISTHVFFEQRLHVGLLDTMYAVAARHSTAVPTIEVFAARHHFDYTNRTAVRDIASWFRSNEVRAVLHQPIYLSDRADAQWSRHVAPNLDLISQQKTLRIDSMDEVKRAIECAEQVPFTAAVIHLGLNLAPWDEAAIDNALTAIEHLHAFAAPLGVRLLIENLQNDVTSPPHLVDILHTGHFAGVGVCLDLGHLHLTQPPNSISPDSGLTAAIATLGPRIAQVHLHDNHGAFGLSNGHQVDVKDEHLWPGTGTIDWAAVSEQLAKLPDTTPSILEIASDRDASAEEVAQKSEQAFRLIEDLSRPRPEHA
jgi:sugar phosphate isomerase/epimerase